jgi:hypothetical protein
MTRRNGDREDARRVGSLTVAGLIGLLLSACAPAEPQVPLARAFASPQAVAEEVLGALARRDRAHLDALAMTEHEFRTVVWPMLPSSRPQVGLPADYVWQDLHARSTAHLLKTVEGVGGRAFDLVGVQFLGDTTDYDRFRVHRDSVLYVRTGSGETQRIRVFGSMIEYEGRFKIFSYVVD